MSKFFLIKLNRANGTPELLETIEADSLLSARKITATKYTGFITDVNIGVAVVNKSSYEKHWKNQLRREK